MNYSSTTSGTCNVYSPINISQRHSYGKCVDKCDFSFKYDNSSIKLTNKGTYLNITCDDTNNSPVTYNTRKYKVSDIRIYAPSLHTYNGAKLGGEMVIIHTPVVGGNQLFVCIPIRLGQPSNTGSEIISTIIQASSLLIPTDKDSKTLDSIKNFNLNMIIPKKTYYYYEGVNFLDVNKSGISCPASIPIDVICYLPFISNISVSAVVTLVVNEVMSVAAVSNLVFKTLFLLSLFKILVSFIGFL